MIAIVGNSGSVLEHRGGAFIDSHDLVVRFNEAPTQDFEEYVGSKTDIRFIAYRGADYNLRDENIFLYSHNKKALKEGLKKLSYNNNVKILDKEFINSCDNLISKPYWKWRLMPNMIMIHKIMSTTGLKAIVFFNSGINLFGFSQVSQFHYWEKNREGYKFSNCHSREKETQIIKGYEREGKLKIFS